MNKIESNYFRDVLNDNIEVFKNSIYDCFKIGANNIINNPINDNPFEIFNIDNTELNKYKKAENHLYSLIYEHLIISVFKTVFPPEITKWPVLKSLYIDFSIGSLEDIYPFEFIINDCHGKSVGYRFTLINLDRKEIKSICKKCKVEKIVIIDWSNGNRNYNSYKESMNYKGITSVDIIPIRIFLEDILSSEDVEFYISSVNDAIKYANSEIGFQTIPSFSTKYLNSFKNEVQNNIFSFPYKEKRYFDIKEKYYKGLPTTSDDHNIIQNNYFEKELYKIVCGDNGFSKCFITAEYLYTLTKNGGSFEYTSIVCGYLKSIEQLMYEIIKYKLENQNDNDEILWIKCVDKDKYSDNVRKNPKSKKYQYYQIKFKKEFEDNFDISLGSLIYFFIDDINGWNIQEIGKKAICRCFDDYRSICRNEHFHKDNIYCKKEADYIRDNTYMLIYYLLGAYNLKGSKEDILHYFNYADTSFDNFYRIISSTHGINFVLEFENDKRINALRLINQPHTVYDKHGNINNSSIEFIELDEFKFRSEDEYLNLISNSPKIIINKNNMPTRVWKHISKDKDFLIYENNIQE